MSLAEALGAALAALAAPGNGNDAPLTAGQLEVAILDRARSHRAFRRLQGARLEQLLTEARAEAPATEPDADSAAEPPAEPPTGPAAPGSDGTP
jgi:proteasome alpha subunit